MLVIEIPATELFDEESNTLITTERTYLELEHSLVALSKWESKHKKRFLDNNVEKTNDETFDYIRCMALNTIPEESYTALFSNPLLIQKIFDYITDTHTATVIKATGSNNNGEAVTSELIYYWMVAAQIPWEAQYWHLNRLITLISLVGEKNKPQKKMSAAEVAKQNHALNQARKAKRGK